MNAWLRQHGQCMAGAARKMLVAPLGTLLNVFVIGIALALPLGGHSLLQNARILAAGMESGAQISVFLAKNISSAEVNSVEAQLKNLPGVRNARLVPRDQALAELARKTGLEDVVASLRENPLPDAIVLSLADSNPALAEEVAQSARAVSGVNHVHADALWSRRLAAAIDLGNAAVAILGLLLSLALIGVTLNTVRLQIVTQQDEIEVSRLIGATDAYIRRPFFYQGALLGLLGGAAALAILYLALLALDRNVAALADLYGSNFRILLFNRGDNLAVLLFSGLLGWLGAFLSVSIHLRSIN